MIFAVYDDYDQEHNSDDGKQKDNKDKKKYSIFLLQKVQHTKS